MKTVSIVIPVYNVEAYLTQCMDSLLQQTYSALEIILVNDGSLDGSGHLCDAYAKKDPRVTVIHQANAGAANAKNAGLDRATGDYLTFMDSDDYAEPDWIRRMVQTAEEQDADVVECDFDRVYIDHCEVVNAYDQTVVLTAEEYLAQYLGNWTCSLFWNKLFRRELVTDIRFRKERRCIDDEFFTYKAVSGAGKVARIGDVLYHYRQRASGAVSSEKNRLQITDDSLEILIERYQWICQRFPNLRQIYLCHDIEIMFYFARKFLFCSKTVKKFRKIARFYLKEALMNRCQRAMLFYALQLQTISLCCDPSDTASVKTVDTKGYFS